MNKREMAAARKLNVEQRAAPPAELPPKPWMLFDKVTPNGLRMIELAATAGNSQNKIAALLGITRAKFKTMLDASGEATPVRLAWEAGESEKESALVRGLVERAAAGDSNAAMFLLRVDHARRDSGPSVEITNGPRISVLLPGHMSEEDYYKKLGLVGPTDTRSADQRGSLARLMGRAVPDETPIQMRDVTPAPAPMPAAPAPASTALTPQTGQRISSTFGRTTSF